MTSLSIDTAAWVAPPDPVLELDALATQLTVGSTVLTTPSDATGERPIGDALLIAP